MRRLIDKIGALLTKNYKEVPLLRISFDLEKYQRNGTKGSCMCTTHPELSKDEILLRKMFDLVDYIRSNYDMEKLSKL